MPTDIANDVYLDIPEWVTSLAAFRRWTQELDFPEKGNIWWLRGKVWADMSSEQLFSHLEVKSEVLAVLRMLVRKGDLGFMWADGLLLTNERADLSGNPDATFISHEALADGRVVLIEGKREGYTEAQGSPDMVLEVVSKRSEKKDYTILREDYFTAGVREYWLVDARQNPPSFEILKRGTDGFVASRRQGGWVKSAVFGCSFKLDIKQNRSGKPAATLEVK
jgi:Uma2 family endonuclease